MKGKAFKWAVLGGALAVVVMYGIEMSTAGIERINGPIEGIEYAEAQAADPKPEPSEEPISDIALAQRQKIAKLEQELEEVKRLAGLAGPEPSEESVQENERLPGIPIEADQPAVNRIADSTSGLLQNMSSEGIRLVVSIFDGLIK